MGIKDIIAEKLKVWEAKNLPADERKLIEEARARYKNLPSPVVGADKHGEMD